MVLQQAPKRAKVWGFAVWVLLTWAHALYAQVRGLSAAPG